MVNSTTSHAEFWYSIISFNFIAIIWITIFLRVATIFKCISLGTPIFSQTIINQLNHLILWLYGIAIVPMFLFPLLSNILTGSYHFVLGIPSGLFLPFGLSLLIEIFKYGASLQYEVDETV
ncbi:hypothetical protein BAU17_08655 [Enterococcus sp. CU12B]|uniref:DUF2975 domain-containing protein n=1 Tax=Candidatus Enterococcus willemsii TaxID=1857215 RepID=A0ABQ6YZC8_9ENTE|nr:hypothetical protein BAU17_08655 [Enterococcus sp. CU12B]